MRGRGSCARDPCGGALGTTRLSLRGLVKGDGHNLGSRSWHLRAFDNRREHHKTGTARETQPWIQLSETSPPACSVLRAGMLVARGQEEERRGQSLGSAWV